MHISLAPILNQLVEVAWGSNMAGCGDINNSQASCFLYPVESSDGLHKQPMRSLFWAFKAVPTALIQASSVTMILFPKFLHENGDGVWRTHGLLLTEAYKQSHA